MPNSALSHCEIVDAAARRQRKAGGRGQNNQKSNARLGEFDIRRDTLAQRQACALDNSATADCRRSIANSSIRLTHDSCGLQTQRATSLIARPCNHSVNTRSVKTIVVANTSAPQATCATVIPTIGFNGCGSFGDANRVRYAATPKNNCNNQQCQSDRRGTRQKRFAFVPPQNRRMPRFRA